MMLAPCTSNRGAWRPTADGGLLRIELPWFRAVGSAVTFSRPMIHTVLGLPTWILDLEWALGDDTAPLRNPRRPRHHCRFLGFRVPLPAVGVVTIALDYRTTRSRSTRTGAAA